MEATVARPPVPTHAEALALLFLSEKLNATPTEFQPCARWVIKAPASQPAAEPVAPELVRCTQLLFFAVTLLSFAISTSG